MLSRTLPQGLRKEANRAFPETIARRNDRVEVNRILVVVLVPDDLDD